MALGWQTKISWTGVLILAWSAKVREEEDDYISDAIATGSTAIAVGAIWWPEIRATMVGAAMGTAAAPIAAVAVSTYAIGGLIAFAAADPDDEGWYGAEALKEYYHDPIGTTADIATEYIVDPVADWTQEEIIDPVVGWTLRRVNDLAQAQAQFVSALPTKEEIFNNRYLNPFGYPF